MAEPINSAIELHDSVLTSVTEIGRAIQVAFEPAYVHKSVGRPGVDPGSGFIQDVVFEIEDGQTEGEVGTLPSDVFHGAVELGTVTSENMVTLPIGQSSPVRLSLFLAPDNRRISITGKSLTVRPASDPEYVEEFKP